MFYEGYIPQQLQRLYWCSDDIGSKRFGRSRTIRLASCVGVGGTYICIESVELVGSAIYGSRTGKGGCT